MTDFSGAVLSTLAQARDYSVNCRGQQVLMQIRGQNFYYTIPATKVRVSFNFQAFYDREVGALLNPQVNYNMAGEVTFLLPKVQKLARENSAFAARYQYQEMPLAN